MYKFHLYKMVTYVKGQQTALADLKLWGAFFIYVIVAGYAISHHELWGDEIHSWNIAKASNSFLDLINNTRYEGHPPVWYIILWGISKFTHNPAYIQVAQLIIASSVTLLVLFYSPFPTLTKLLIPFGYYFLFEYGVLSRNYAIGILPTLYTCYILQKEFRYKFFLYYALLLFMSNTHLLAMLLAGSIHLYFLLLNFEQKKKINQFFFHSIMGILVFLPALYFIFPPSDSGLNIGALMNKFENNSFGIIAKTPMRTFIPIPAWWEHNFWNTQFLLQLQDKNSVLRPVTLLLSIGLLGIVWFILKENKKALALFVANLAFTFIIAFIFPLTTQRYIGFIYIGFIAALWLYRSDKPISKKKTWFINSLLVIQVIAGFFTVSKDIQLPFSNSYRVNELINEVPRNEKIVTDYWCVNTISAFSDKRFFCVGSDSTLTFLLWKKETGTAAKTVYLNSMKKLFENEGLKKIYLISTYTLKIISELDQQLEKVFLIKMVDKREGAIEKWSNLYLYEITPLNRANK